MYSTSWCGDCVRSKAFLDARNVPYKEIDIDKDGKAAKLVEKINKGFRSVPTIIFPDGSILTEPNDKELENKLKMLKILH